MFGWLNLSELSCFLSVTLDAWWLVATSLIFSDIFKATAHDSFQVVATKYAFASEVDMKKMRTEVLDITHRVHQTVRLHYFGNANYS